jgi:hypothetical protein
MSHSAESGCIGERERARPLQMPAIRISLNDDPRSAVTSRSRLTGRKSTK